MHSSATLAFGNMDDFQAAMGTEGVTSLVVTQRGRFQASLTQVTLHSLRLSAVQEALSRIAFVRVPDDKVLLSFSIDCTVPQIWAGMSTHSQNLVMIGPGQGIHARLTGPCHWANIWLPTKILIQYGQVVSDHGLSVPAGISTWRPSHSTARQLRDLHFLAIRAVHARSSVLMSAEATHGLEQQVLDALVLGLSERPLNDNTANQREEHELMARLEDLLTIRPDGKLGVAELSSALSASAKWLRRCCEARFGMSLLDFLMVRRLQSAHRHLCRAEGTVVRVADIAERYGFRDRGRFAGSYHDFFGELPSATLHHTNRGALAPLVRRGVAGVRIRSRTRSS